MKSTITAMILLMVCQARCDKVCQPPQSESLFYLTGSNSDFFVANDFTQGLVLAASGTSGNGDRWVLADLKAGITYVGTPEGGCHYKFFPSEIMELYDQCLPGDAELVRSGFVDFYLMPRPGNTWFVGMKSLPDTDYSVRHFSRYSWDGTVDQSLTYGVLYEYSLGISDPTIFQKDLSVCVEGEVDEGGNFAKDFHANKGN
ncbi:hypothetical protein RRG08_009560 [Elysia crispata]|uniref:Uncharacterized protein n=1 Tax=Elysia crispata TaxID=231223 RepID=A0AAE1DH92_9GAST|nr:hypothetical protein RRG08_009560 [Elysia crispata]